MQRCSASSQGGVAMVGPCTCGVFHSSFSIIFNPTSSFDLHASSPVDCTLSLATPSARMSSHPEDHRRLPPYFFWDTNNSHNAARSSAGSIDTLLARRCANCDTTSTPLWRNGPGGPKSLCNACGIRYKKEERRASAAAKTGGAAEREHDAAFNNSTWVHQKAACNEYRVVEDVESRDSFLSWRLNVTELPGLVHDFTR